MSVVSSRRRQKSWQIADEIASLLDGMALDGEHLGERLRRLARARDLASDEEAARHIGVSYRQYQRWLSGESEPRGSSLKLIAEGLGVPVAELVGEPDPSQLDRIEEMLVRLLDRVAPGEPLTPEGEFDDAVDEIEDEEEGGRPGEGPGPA